jgi:hypothetical protein
MIPEEGGREGGREGGGYEGRGRACAAREGGKQAGWELPVDAPRPTRYPDIQAPFVHHFLNLRRV